MSTGSAWLAQSRVGLHCCLRSILAALVIGTGAGCARPLVAEDLTAFGKAYDESLVIKTTELPPALAGREYAFALRAGGKFPPYRWMLLSGQLPAGLQLYQDGAIRGTPEAPGVATFVVKVGCETPVPTSKRGSTPHVGWRKRHFTLLVKGVE